MDVTRIMREQWDRCLGWAGIALGVVFLILGWVGVSGTGYTAAQIPYVVSGGLGGIVCVATGSILLLSADLQDDWRKLDALEAKLDRLADTEEQASRLRSLEVRLDEMAQVPARATARRSTGARRGEDKAAAASTNGNEAQ